MHPNGVDIHIKLATFSSHQWTQHLHIHTILYNDVINHDDVFSFTAVTRCGAILRHSVVVVTFVFESRPAHERLKKPGGSFTYHQF